MPAACSQAPGAYSGLEEDSKGKTNAKLTKATRRGDEDDDAYEDDENVENQQEKQQPKRMQRKRDRIAALAREEAKEAKAADLPVFYPHVHVEIPADLEHLGLEQKAEEFVANYALRFYRHSRGNYREDAELSSDYNLVSRVVTPSGTVGWMVKLYGKYAGRCATERQAEVLAQKVLEFSGFPREFLNFNEKGVYCYSKKAQLALFEPFTSDVKYVHQVSQSGKYSANSEGKLPVEEPMKRRLHHCLQP